ncbi:hypothetical protein GE09DRAFT_1047315 [Coniochaeta sp. 2T2.1]|nr:hypothetical protein GE09DRAFT_1047315 [Coniochaeta sp. 2T2.1]
MAHCDPAPPQLSVNNILAFRDAELVQYLKQNRRADGGFDLDLDGWEHLQKDQRDQLAARLKVGAQKANEVAESRPVDLDQVTARLLQLPDSRDTLAQPRPGPSRYERAATEEVDYDALEKKCETCAYDDLLDEGGLPVYPIDLLEEVSADPEQYRDRLRPWQEYPDTSELYWNDVFQKQLKRWRDFRAWQVDNRGLQDDEREYHEFLERRKLDEERRGLDWLKIYPGATESEYYEDRKSEWDELQVRRYNDWFWLREDHGRGEFPGYVEEVKRRLAKHGFTRTFQLDEDPKRQDKLTTWIEYINYEYSWYDRYARLFKRLQPKYDAAWQKLVDSGVLRPGETDEFLRTDESSLGRQTAKDQARAAVKFAEAAANAALRETEKAKHGQSRLTVQERKRRLARAHSRLGPAKQALKMIMRRCDLIREFIKGTWPWLREKRNVYRHGLLLHWILEQVPVIEAELNQPKMTEGGSHGGRDVATPRSDQDSKIAENRRSAIKSDVLK